MPHSLFLQKMRYLEGVSTGCMLFSNLWINRGQDFLDLSLVCIYGCHWYYSYKYHTTRSEAYLSGDRLWILVLIYVRVTRLLSVLWTDLPVTVLIFSLLYTKTLSLAHFRAVPRMMHIVLSYCYATVLSWSCNHSLYFRGTAGAGVLYILSYICYHRNYIYLNSVCCILFHAMLGFATFHEERLISLKKNII